MKRKAASSPGLNSVSAAPAERAAVHAAHDVPQNHNQMANRPPVIKEFKLTVEEKKIVVDEDGTTMQAMTFVRGGPAGAAHYTFRQPGVYAYAKHNLIEAAMLGATARISRSTANGTTT